MPNLPKKQCNFLGCPKTTNETYCDEHQKHHWQTDQLTRQQRGYDEQWLRFRKNYLMRNPLCVECLKNNHTTAATDIHHIKPLKMGGSKYAFQNLKALCRECHNKQNPR